MSTSESLWGSLPTTTSRVTPCTLIREQAELLGNAMGGRLTARTELLDKSQIARQRRALEAANCDFMAKLIVAAPGLDGYEHEVIRVYYPMRAYPAVVVDVTDDIKHFVDDHDEMMQAIADVLSSSSLHEVLEAMLAHVVDRTGSDGLAPAVMAEASQGATTSGLASGSASGAAAKEAGRSESPASRAGDQTPVASAASGSDDAATTSPARAIGSAGEEASQEEMPAKPATSNTSLGALFGANRGSKEAAEPVKASSTAALRGDKRADDDSDGRANSRRSLFSGS